jgi:hypothetical protein
MCMKDADLCHQLHRDASFQEKDSAWKLAWEVEKKTQINVKSYEEQTDTRTSDMALACKHQ